MFAPSNAEVMTNLLCRNEEELKKIESTAIASAEQWVGVLRDQIYPVKVNNTRADAVLMPDSTLKPNATAEIAVENGTELAKVAWLSAKQNSKAYRSLVACFTKGPEPAL